MHPSPPLYHGEGMNLPEHPRVKMLSNLNLPVFFCQQVLTRTRLPDFALANVWKISTVLTFLKNALPVIPVD